MKNYTQLNLLIFFLLTVTPFVTAQERTNDNLTEISTDLIHEQIVITPDRTLYAVDEKIKFKADYFTRPEIGEKSWSTVLYVELIKPDGVSVTQYKFPLSNNGSWGEIHIPKQLLTGIYYLKAYTKWMRNFPVEDYAYQQVKIINPKKSKLLHSDVVDDAKVQLQQSPPKENTKLSVSISKNSFSTRENGTISITNSDRYFQDYNHSVSIVKKETFKLDPLKPVIQNDSPDVNFANYLPELNGISISGKVIDAASSKPIENARVNLSLLNHHSHFSGFNTNKQGDFYFTLPYSEHLHDFFISTVKDSLKLTINIDNDFCQKAISLENPEFELTEQEKSIAEEISVNAQLLSRFKTSSLTVSVNDSTKEEVSFYGSPNKVFYTQKYIDLPNMEEFIFELITELNVIRKKGIPYIHSASWNVFHNYPVLVLVDNVPISDTKEFLKMKINSIERVEVINKSYVAGNMKYSGIISAFSKNEDMGGIELPENSLFFSYQTFTQKENSSGNNHGERIPDLRNCLYWNPNLEFEKDTPLKLDFLTADTKGEYEVIVWSIPKDGSPKMVNRKTIVVN